MKTKKEAYLQARTVVDGWAKKATLTGWIPGSSLFLTATDALMIRQVADAFAIGVFDMGAVKAHLGGLVAGVVGGSVASELFGLIPVVGWAAKSLVMGMKTDIVGTAVIKYFNDLSPLPE